MILLVGVALAHGGADLLPVREETLPNGLRVVAHQMEGAARMAVRLVLPAGAARDPEGQAGLAHLVEHLAYTGTRDAPGNAGDRWLEAAGGASAAWTDHETLTFESVGPAAALPLALFLESDRIAGIEPSEASLTVQRDVIARERALRGAEGRIRGALAELLWPVGHPYRRPVLGTAEELGALTLSDVRASLARWVQTRGALLVIVSPMPAATSIEEARRWFGELPGEVEPTEADGPAEADAPRAEATSPAPRVSWLPLDIYPDTLRFGWRLPDGVDLRAFEAVAAVLRERLRAEEPDVRTWSMRLGGAFVLALDTTTPWCARARVEAALRALRTRGPEPEELERWRAVTRTRELVQLERPEGRAALLSACVAETGEPDCLPARWRAREALEPDAVRAAAQSHLGRKDGVVLLAAPRRRFPGAARRDAP